MQNIIPIDDFIEDYRVIFDIKRDLQPWEMTNDLCIIISDLILKLDNNYSVYEGIAIHKSATIEQGAILKAPIIIEENCFIGAHAYLRGGVYLGKSTVIGPSCEIKSSVILNNSTIAHFNFIGDSILGNNVNFEAGSVTANSHNDRLNKEISVIYHGNLIHTNSEKFGSLVGDNSKIGANAVLSPGTILEKNSIIKRLELVEQT